MFELLPEPPFEETPPFEDVPPPDEDVEVALVADTDGDDSGLYDDACLDPESAEAAAAAQALDELDAAVEADRLDGLDAEGVLAEAAGTKVSVRRVQARQLVLAARWADLHAVLPRPWMTTPGGERLVRLGGAGTPEVAEFAAAELGAMLEVSDHTAAGLVADALDLRHRLPRLWVSVQAGFVDVWVARRIAQQTRPLSLEAAARVDGRIAGVAATLTWTRLRTIVQKEILAADPPQALDDAARAAERAGVFVSPETSHGFQEMIINAAAGDVQALDTALEEISRALKTLGDTRPPQQRRATAVGIIANPHTALDLINQAEQVRKAHRDTTATRRAGNADTADQIAATHPDEVDPDGRSDGRTGNPQTADQIAATHPDGVDPDGRSDGQPDGRTGNQRPFAFKTAVVYYHLTREALDKILAGEPFAGATVGRVEDLGPLILDQIKQWLHHANVVLKPVIDLADVPPVDHYETPPRISEAIGLVRSADSFPYATSTSRRQDNEHTTPYQPMNHGGPPGQTNPLTMSKMTRRHHRLKTHAGWTTTQLRTGTWLYRSPHHYYLLVDQHGTTPLGKLS